MPTQAANATTINPGMTRRAKARPPLMPARNILLIVLVESPPRIGKTASVALIFPDATSEATEIVAECVSTEHSGSSSQRPARLTPELAFLAGTAAGSPSGRPQPIAGVETAVLTPTKFYEPPRQGLRSGRWSD